jgi:hypothetical protein
MSLLSLWQLCAAPRSASPYITAAAAALHQADFAAGDARIHFINYIQTERERRETEKEKERVRERKRESKREKGSEREREIEGRETERERGDKPK